MYHVGSVSSILERFKQKLNRTLKSPEYVRGFIIKAQKIELSLEQMQRYLKYYLERKRLAKSIISRIIDLLDEQEKTIWGMLQALTYFTSHISKVQFSIINKIHNDTLFNADKVPQFIKFIEKVNRGCPSKRRLYK